MKETGCFICLRGAIGAENAIKCAPTVARHTIQASVTEIRHEVPGAPAEVSMSQQRSQNMPPTNVTLTSSMFCVSVLL